MEQKYHKAINFDLSTHQLEEVYPKENYRKAYLDLNQFFKEHHFSHRQGSGYLSEEQMSSTDVFDLMNEMGEQLPWMKDCVNKIDVTNVGKEYDLVELLRPTQLLLANPKLLTKSEKIE